MARTLSDILASPDFYLHSFEGDDALFVPMDRAAYVRSIFLDHRIQPASEEAIRVPCADLTSDLPILPTNWIFHVAHCGSTLLARALETLSGGLALREPLALRQLALMPANERQVLLPSTLALLARRYDTGAPTLIKANVPVNFIADEIAGLMPDARGILVYADLPDYLYAVLRSDNHRQWVRNVTGLLAPYLGPLPVTDAERTAALWFVQIKRFADLADRGAHFATLDAEGFFDNPAPTLEAAARHLGMDVSPDAVRQVIASSLFTTYAKNPERPFDNTARHAQRTVAMATMATEVRKAQDWLNRERADWAAVLAKVAHARLH